jgi:hypothetical protein
MQQVIFNEGQGDDEFRHRCLVRQVLRWRVTDRQYAHQFLNGWVEKDGRWVPGWNERHPKSILERDVRDQWKKGNRGENGEWK